MELRTVEEHYNATKPKGWLPYAAATDGLREHAARLIESARRELGVALLAVASELDLVTLIDTINRSGSAVKPTDVAVEIGVEENGRLEWVRFWNGEPPYEWESMQPEEKRRWSVYAKTIHRTKVSPGKRMYQALAKGLGFNGLFEQCSNSVRTAYDDAAKELGIAEVTE